MYTLLIGTGVGAGVILGITLSLTGIRLDVASLLASLFGGVFWLTLFSRLYTRKMAPATDSYVFGPRTVSVADDGIGETSQRHESLFRWTSVRSIESVGEHVFIMVDRNAGIVVPHRAFASDAERDQFLAEIRKRSGMVPQ
jgi:hypothetical protein